MENIENNISNYWDNEAIPSLSDFIKIPNTSPMFDNNWESNKLLDKACDHIYNYVIEQNIPNLKVKKLQLDNSTPLLYLDYPSNNNNKTVFIYGHYDKQPHLPELWINNFKPTVPQIVNGKLYGRGAVDDGYALYLAIGIIKQLSIKKLNMDNISHPRIIVLIEGSEESGSIHLQKYMPLISIIPDYVICLDSGCVDYDRMYLTTSLRGILVLKLSVKVLEEGIHSGMGSGVIPSSFRILRMLLDKIEDPFTGEMKIIDKLSNIDIDKYKGNFPENINIDAKNLYKNLCDIVPNNNLELFINNGLKANMEITGMDGIPNITNSANVLRSETTITISIRLPPNVNPITAYDVIYDKIFENIPYNAQVKLDIIKKGTGLIIPEFTDEELDVMNNGSQKYYSNPITMIPVGGTVPFMNVFSKMFPNSKYLITGCVGPNANPHGPNEMLNINYVKKLNCVLYDIVSNIK